MPLKKKKKKETEEMEITEEENSEEETEEEVPDMQEEQEETETQKPALNLYDNLDFRMNLLNQMRENNEILKGIGQNSLESYKAMDERMNDMNERMIELIKVLEEKLE